MTSPGWCAAAAHEPSTEDLARWQDVDLNDPRAEDALLATPVVQEALAGIEQDLASVAEDGAGSEALRPRAQEGGERLAALAFGDRAT